MPFNNHQPKPVQAPTHTGDTTLRPRSALKIWGDATNHIPLVRRLA